MIDNCNININHVSTFNKDRKTKLLANLSVFSGEYAKNLYSNSRRRRFQTLNVQYLFLAKIHDRFSAASQSSGCSRFARRSFVAGKNTGKKRWTDDAIAIIFTLCPVSCFKKSHAKHVRATHEEIHKSYDPVRLDVSLFLNVFSPPPAPRIHDSESVDGVGKII